MSLQEYKAKRNFKITSEPLGKKTKSKSGNLFVVQKHDATRLHYDFRLELDGVLKSWAVPKGPSLDPKVKRLAVEVEDHPLDYATFEGKIPEGEYGAGHVIVWDIGTWIPPEKALQDLKKGRIEFELKGKKLSGKWILVRTNSRTSAKASTKSKGEKHNWLLIKRSDSFVSKKDITKQDQSVLTGVDLETLEEDMKESKFEIPEVKKKDKMPSFVSPQLAYLGDKAPRGEEWVHEVKFDGYRTLCHIDQKKVKLLTRKGLNWNHKYEHLVRACELLPVSSAIIDGEIVWLDEDGRTSFDGLQKALQDKRSESLTYCVFDLLYLNGHDLRDLPLILRKDLLKEVLRYSSAKNIVYSEHWEQEGEDVLKASCSAGLEGIISKDATAPYRSQRSRTWIKSKCTNTQEFVIGGYTHQQNRATLGAILLGAYNQNGDFQYVGKVGTGFDQKNLKILWPKLTKLKTKESPFDVKRPKEKNLTWVEPSLVANIEFGAWTQDKILRHAAYKGLREDKSPTQVRLEEETLPESKAVTLTKPDKILFSKSKNTKEDLAQYYMAIEKWILPHIERRPLALLRCPNGESKQCFFQKHLETNTAGVIEEVTYSELQQKNDDYIYVESINGILSLAQLATLEMHVRGSRKDYIDYADQMVFDLDPDPGTKWQAVIDAAYELKELLDRLDLISFLKVTGGKGLHIHVPVQPKYNWDLIKSFAKTLCNQLVEQSPNKYTTNTLKKKRKGKIFLDYLRNGYGATAICPYSVRAKPEASVALPIAWKDLKTLEAPNAFTLSKVPGLLKRRKDPWADYFRVDQGVAILDAALE